MLKIVAKIILKKIRNKDINISSNLSSYDLFLFFYNKGFWTLIRGFIKKPFIKKSSGLIFIGKNVRILHKNKLFCGSNCYIGDNSYLNCLSKNGVHIHNSVTIRENAWLQLTSDLSNLGEGIIIDSNVYIGPNVILGAAGLLHIKSGNQIGANVQFIAENHKFQNKEKKISEQGVIRKGIIINENCWIGNNVIILDGVEIGMGSVIGAGSIVTKSIESYSVAVGNPAKIIKMIK